MPQPTLFVPHYPDHLCSVPSGLTVWTSHIEQFEIFMELVNDTTKPPGNNSAFCVSPQRSAAKATALVLPELTGKIDGMAIRVPVPDGSVTDIVAELEKATSVEELNAQLHAASQAPPLQGILSVSDEELVSVDIIGNPHSTIVDASSTRVLNGTMVKILAWYDNEWGYSCRLVELADRLSQG